MADMENFYDDLINNYYPVFILEIKLWGDPFFMPDLLNS